MSSEPASTSLNPNASKASFMYVWFTPANKAAAWTSSTEVFSLSSCIV